MIYIGQGCDLVFCVCVCGFYQQNMFIKANTS